MATAYISEPVIELGGLVKFGICYGRDSTHERFYSMWSKHDYPLLKVRKEIVVSNDYVPQLRNWEKYMKAFYKQEKNVIFRKKHIYTVVGERTYDYIGEKDGAANGGTEFFLLNMNQVMQVEESLEKLHMELTQ